LGSIRPTDWGGSPPATGEGRVARSRIRGSRAVPLAAQDDIATAGSGGYATASSSGGAVGIGDVNSGGNVGNAVAVGDTYGAVWVDGGDVANSTSIGVSADGGTAIADASGGSYNVAFVS
jgi:hypothetical protein